MQLPRFLPWMIGVTTAAYVANFIVYTLNPPTTDSGFQAILQFITFTNIQGMPAIWAFVLFMLVPFPWLCLILTWIFGFITMVTAGSAANNVGGQIIIAGAIVTLIGTAIALIIAVLN